VYFLSGLTCTDENFITKAGAQRAAAKHGLALICPDTSPRTPPSPSPLSLEPLALHYTRLGQHLNLNDLSVQGGVEIEGADASWDFGFGAGFYVNATEPKWAKHFRMYDYVTKELPQLVNANLPVDASRVSVFGHSMGVPHRVT
jgi:S-formylglutathione hydrolase